MLHYSHKNATRMDVEGLRGARGSRRLVVGSSTKEALTYDLNKFKPLAIVHHTGSVSSKRGDVSHASSRHRLYPRQARASSTSSNGRSVSSVVFGTKDGFRNGLLITAINVVRLFNGAMSPSAMCIQNDPASGSQARCDQRNESAE